MDEDSLDATTIGLPVGHRQSSTNHGGSKPPTLDSWLQWAPSSSGLWSLLLSAERRAPPTMATCR
jgi:hypothetical protein